MNVFPLPGSPDLGRLVQERLKKVQQRFPAVCPSTLDDFRVVVDELLSIANVCQTVTKRLAAEKHVYDAAEAFKQIERTLDWAECMAPSNSIEMILTRIILVLDKVKVDPMPSERTLLFRAHDQAATDQPGVYRSAARRIPFDEQYRQQHSVQEFLKSVGRHLGKKEIEKRTGQRLRTKFTSTSPQLNWTLHLTAQKSRDLQDQVDFVIFDLRALCLTPDITVFRITDVLRFLEASSQTSLIPQEYQQWARNCDEYLVMGKDLEKGIVQITPWTELQYMSIVNDAFRTAYTLSLYRRFRDDRMGERVETEYGKACEMVVSAAKTIAGQMAGDVGFVKDIVKLILQAGLWFWGVKSSRSETEISIGCEELLENGLEDGLATTMSQVSL